MSADQNQTNGGRADPGGTGPAPAAATGAVRAEPPPIVPVAVVARRPRLRAGRVTLILLAYLGVQLLVGVVVGIVALVSLTAKGINPNDSKQLLEAVRGMLPAAVLFSVIAGGAAILGLARLLLWRDELRDGSPIGAAWRVGRPQQLAWATALGLLIGLLYLLLGTVIPSPPDDAAGPLARMAITPGLPQLVWILVALLFSPPMEELLFRGVMYGGFRASLGPVWAAVLTTGIFWLLHITETACFWPSMLAIGALAVAALGMRLHAGAVGPAVAVHAGYNAVLVLAMLYSTT